MNNLPKAEDVVDKIIFTDDVDIEDRIFVVEFPRRSIGKQQKTVQWYNNKEIVPTLEAMKKTTKINHDKGNVMLKLGSIQPNLAMLVHTSQLTINFTLKTCVNQTFGLMPVNSILILCVGICQLAYIQDGTTMRKHKNSTHGKIEFERLKRHSFLFSSNHT